MCTYCVPTVYLQCTYSVPGPLPGLSTHLDTPVQWGIILPNIFPPPLKYPSIPFPCSPSKVELYRGEHGIIWESGVGTRGDTDSSSWRHGDIMVGGLVVLGLPTQSLTCTTLHCTRPWSDEWSWAWGRQRLGGMNGEAWDWAVQTIVPLTEGCGCLLTTITTNCHLLTRISPTEFVAY